jgi:hypothetical protein
LTTLHRHYGLDLETVEQAMRDLDITADKPNPLQA